MEYAPGGDMFQYVVKERGLDETEARWFYQQLIFGLDYCHKKVSMTAGDNMLLLPNLLEKVVLAAGVLAPAKAK